MRYCFRIIVSKQLQELTLENANCGRVKVAEANELQGAILILLLRPQNGIGYHYFGALVLRESKDAG